MGITTIKSILQGISSELLVDGKYAGMVFQSVNDQQHLGKWFVVIMTTDKATCLLGPFDTEDLAITAGTDGIKKNWTSSQWDIWKVAQD